MSVDLLMAWMQGVALAVDASAASASTSRTNEQLQPIVQGWVAIAMLAAIGALGMALIAVLLAVWRRSLRREQRLEEEIREVRSSLSAIGDAWAASATRIPGFAPRNTPPEDEGEDEDDESDEDDDPYNLFGGRDPLEDENDDDDEDDHGFLDDDDDRPPPGFR